MNTITDKRVWDWRTLILHDGPNNATYKHLLLTLSCYMDSAGQSCFPSISTLEKATSLSRPTLVKYLKKAEEDGWIMVKRTKSKNNEWRRNEYTASLPDKVVKEINHPPQKVVKEVNGVGNEVNQGSKTDTPEVVKEVNSISPYNSSINSPERAPAREDDSGETKDPPTRMFGVPVPDELRSSDGFVQAYRDWWEYMRRVHNKHPNAWTVEQQYQKLLTLMEAGDQPADVIHQSMEHESKSFYPIRDDGSRSSPSDTAFQSEGRPNAGAYNFS